MSNICVQKFGGSALGTADHLGKAVLHVQEALQRGMRVAVVVSAFAGKTNDLLAEACKIGPGGQQAEQDVIVSCGEQMAAGLFALALERQGISARSWLGWQLPILTDEAHQGARIQSVDVAQLLKNMDAGTTPVVAGFQGVTQSGRISTLGREGSDITAAALAAKLQANRCVFFKDVAGLYTHDPKHVATAERLEHLSYAEAERLVRHGARVLHPDVMAWASAANIPLEIRSVDGPIGPTAFCTVVR